MKTKKPGFFNYLYSIYAMVMFVITMLLLFPFFIIASLFGKINGGNIIYRICNIWGDVWFFLIGISHKNIYEIPHDKGKQYIFVANHISYLDVVVLVKTIRQPLRALGKIEMKKIPLFGFIYSYVVVAVDRADSENRAKSIKNLKSILLKGISVIIFPEGTFNMTGKPIKELYNGAFRIAIETQTAIKPVLFLDTYKRMPWQSIFLLNPGKSRSVFLEEIPVDNYTIDDIDKLKEIVFNKMEEKLVEYKVSWIE